MKIGHVVASIADMASGPSYSVPETCNALANIGHEVELHVLDHDGATHRPESKYRLFAHERGRSSPFLGSPAMHQGLNDAAQRLDILHWHGLWRMPSIYPYWATRGTQCHLLMSPKGMLEPAALARNAFAKRLSWALLQGRAVRASSCLHATSKQEALSIRRQGIPQPIAVIGYGIHLPEEPFLEQLRTGGHRAGRRKLLSLGRIHPIKGIDRLILAWRQVQDQFFEWDLDIVGPDEANYLNVLKVLSTKIGARVSFFPSALGDDRDLAFASADFFILPSHSENFAMTIAEALSFGVPVICSKGTPWSQVEAEGCGYWVENSSEALMAVLSRALNSSREETTRMGQNGRSWMRREFTWEQKARQMEAVYLWVLGRGVRPEWVMMD